MQRINFDHMIELYSDFKLALSKKASLFFDGNKFYSEKPIEGCSCEIGKIRLNLKDFTVLIDLDDTLFHNDFAEEIFFEYYDSQNPVEKKIKILSKHYQYLSKFSAESFDWERISKEDANEEVAVFDLKNLQDKYYRKPFVYAFRGSKKLLRILKISGCKIYAYTNGYSKYQKKLLEDLGLIGFFDEIYSPDITGTSKVYFFKKFDFNKEKTIVIGDDLFYDVEVPTYYGYKTVLIYKKLKGVIGAPATFPTYSFYDLNSFMKAILDQ